MKVFVTGATGFVGRQLTMRCLNDGWTVTALVRSANPLFSEGLETVVVAGLERLGDVSDDLQHQDVVVHCAARVHVMTDKSAKPLEEFREVNVRGTLDLAQQAASAGVGRFVYLSSVKVLGESTVIGKAFNEEDLPSPQDDYAQSKFEAEVGLREIATNTGMELVIIRPPLVYGDGVSANFKVMMTALQRGWLLPLGGINNRRSLVAVSNLVDLIRVCMVHPAAANQTFLVSDGDDLSTTQLLRQLGLALNRPARLLPMPAWLLRCSGALCGRSSMAERLCGSLQVDIGKAWRLLGWTPPNSVFSGLHDAAQGNLRETPH